MGELFLFFNAKNCNTIVYGSQGLLPPAFRRNGEGNVFTGVCPSTPTARGGGVPHPRSEQGGTPFLGQDMGYLIPGQDGGRGYQVPPAAWGTLPSAGWGNLPSHQQDGVSPPPHQQDGVPPRSRSQVRTGGGVLPTETAWRVLAPRRAVCLLPSRRRTFLF